MSLETAIYGTKTIRRNIEILSVIRIPNSIHLFPSPLKKIHLYNSSIIEMARFTSPIAKIHRQGKGRLQHFKTTKIAGVLIRISKILIMETSPIFPSSSKKNPISLPQHQTQQLRMFLWKTIAQNFHNP